MYRKIVKKNSDTYDDISRRIYGTPDRAGEIIKLNNNITEGIILVPEDFEQTQKPTGKVCLSCGNVIYDDFCEYVLIDRLKSIKGAVFIFNKTDIDYDFNFGDSVSVFDEEGLFLSGRIANVKAMVDNNLNWLQVEIKSNAGVLAESNMSYPLEFNNVSVKEILQLTANRYNRKITFSSDNDLNEIFTNEIGTTYTADINETVWAFMQRICRSKGLILTDLGDSLFVGRFKANTKEKINLIDGVTLGIKKIKAVISTVGLARYYELNSQYPSTDTATITTPLTLPITKRINSNDLNSMDLQTTATRLACEDIGRHFNLTVEISENLNIKSGDFAVVKFPKIGIKTETDFVVESVERKHPDTTIIEMTLPCAYTYELPDSLPLC